MYQEQVLDNGLRILLVPLGNIQSVSLGIFVKLGSRYESSSQSGMSHFIEHMLFKGSARRPHARLIAETIEGVGGLTNAYTSQETTVYYAKVAAHQTATALDVLTDMVRNPLFKSDDFNRERMVIGEEINMTYDAPDSWVSLLLDHVIWPNHPLGQDVAGTHESLAGMNRDQLVDFYRAGYHPENLLIGIGGAIDPTQTIDEIAQLLGDWQPGVAPEFSPAPARQTESRWHIEHRVIEQGHLCLALPALSRTDPNRYALSVLNTILGEGMSSRLFLNIREERGLAYAVDSGLSLLQDTGVLVVYAGVDPARAPEALKAIQEELLRLRDEPIPEAELHKAKEFIKGRLVLGLEDSFSQTSWVATQSLLLNRVKSLEDVLQIYDAITIEDVQAIAQQIIQPNAYNLAAVGPFGDGKPLSRLLEN